MPASRKETDCQLAVRNRNCQQTGKDMKFQQAGNKQKWLSVTKGTGIVKRQGRNKNGQQETKEQEGQKRNRSWQLIRKE